ncbi:hypothetical protein MKZ38_000027 [Zalerion maritima]|uniref:DUF6604 domain-containing protein n=1 Tax=Zalerion maritima TaxID=339359 RepID=A0AAD5RS05_9PEZI|nr:hypothetical protein MKZ38_000027 [Zalerion maritima]
MLPGTLTTIFQQYKHDVDVVASWLVNTGRQTGFTKGDINPPSDRLKGKARKQAKKGDDPQTPAQPAKKYVLPIKMFVPLAEHAMTAPSVQMVPVWFRATLERAVRVREAFGTRIAGQGDETKKNLSFFVDVLIKVKEALGPKFPEMPKKTQRQRANGNGEQKAEGEDKDNGTPEAELAKNMEDLNVKELVESLINTPDIEVINSNAEPNCEAEQSETMDDVLFAFSALVQDTRLLRSRIANLWSSYLNGTLGLAGVAVATDTCIGLVRQMETSILPLLKKHNRPIGQLLSAYYIGICQSAGHDPTAKENASDDMNFSCYDIGDSTMHNVFTLLRAFRDVLNSKAYPAYKPGHCGVYDPSSKRGEKDSKGKWVEDKVLLMESLPDLILLGREVLGRNKERDELTRLVNYMHSTREIPFALVFAAQVFIDVQRVMRNKSAKPFVEMMVFGGFVANTVGEAMEFHKTTAGKDNIWPRQNDSVMRTVIADGKLWTLDPINQFKISTKLAPPTESNVLLKRHPLFCGLWLHTHRMLFHELGVAYANSWGSVMYTGHLYNAVLHERLLRIRDSSKDSEKSRQKHWKDMDAGFACQEGCFFAVTGEEYYPKDRYAFYESFCKTMGISSADWEKDPKNKKIRTTRKPLRGLMPRGEVSQRFKAGRGGAVNADAIQSIIDSSDWDKREAAKGGPEFGGEGDATADDASNGQNGHKKPKKRVRLSLSALLWQQALALQIETVELSFDYFSLHRTCWNLLKQVRNETEGDITTLLAAGKDEKLFEGEFQAVWLVGYLFMLLKKEKTEASALDQLTKCASMFRNLIAEGRGGQVVGVLRSHLGLQLKLDEEEEDED